MRIVGLDVNCAHVPVGIFRAIGSFLTFRTSRKTRPMYFA